MEDQSLQKKGYVDDVEYTVLVDKNFWRKI